MEASGSGTGTDKEVGKPGKLVKRKDGKGILNPLTAPSKVSFHLQFIVARWQYLW